MNVSMVWHIVITCDREMGSPIVASGWDVLSRLAAVKAVLPNGWNAEAYPVIGQ